MEIKINDFFIDKRKNHLIQVIGKKEKAVTWIVYKIIAGDVPSWRTEVEWPLIYWHDHRFIKTTESVGMTLYGKEKI